MTRWVMITDGPPDPDVGSGPGRALPEELSFYLDDCAEIPIWIGSGMLPAARLPVSDELRELLVEYQIAYDSLPKLEGDPWPPNFLADGHRLIAAANLELKPKGHRVTGRFEFEQEPT